MSKQPGAVTEILGAAETEILNEEGTADRNEKKTVVGEDVVANVVGEDVLATVVGEDVVGEDVVGEDVVQLSQVFLQFKYAPVPSTHFSGISSG